MRRTFEPLSKCTECDLHKSATNPGIPTRCHSLTEQSKAVLIVGEAPGYNEDKEGKSWVGFAGTLLTRFIDASGMSKYADVYLSNACRCRPNMNTDPTVGQVNTCRAHLQKDLDKLCFKYDEVILLACGRWGATAITKQSALKTCLHLQGKTLEYFASLKKGTLTSPTFSPPVPVFFTNHTAILHPSRKPALVIAVQDHFTLLVRYLKGEFIPNSILVEPIVGAPVPPIPDIVCLDIETYGILKKVHQSVFHPVKSYHTDGIKQGKQVVTVSFGFVDSTSATGYRTYVYAWDKHIYYIRKWMEKIVKQGVLLIGQNIKFDLQYLRYNDRILKYWIAPTRLRIDDTLLASFLFYEQRPEKGLKELATLFGLADYSELAVTGKSGTADNSMDPRLHYYNCLDVATTLALYYFTWEQIKKKYGPGSAKLKPVCAKMRNDVLWDVILLEASGSAMDRKLLEEIHLEYVEKCNSYVEKAKESGLIIKGTGSQQSTRDFVTELAQETGVIHDPQFTFTKKKRDVSVGKENIHLLFSRMVEAHKQYELLGVLDKYHKDSKIVGTYTRPLLESNKVGIVHDKMTYPMWYPMPSVGGKDRGSDDKAGGTIQGRLSCKKPAAQTFPPIIQQCITTRFSNGKVLGYDLSQIELRMGALLSGDPIMMMEYKTDIDRHSETAVLIIPGADPNSETFHDRERQLAKILNFLVLYRGGALTFQETAMRELGIHLELSVCENAIKSFDRKYERFRVWQDNLIRRASSQGYLELPTGWSRTFGSEEVNEIVNFPIQTTAAQLLQSAQFDINCQLEGLGLRSKICSQIHDAVYIDCPLGEEKIIDKIVEKSLTNPPLLGIIEEHLGRSVPILYEKK